MSGASLYFLECKQHCSNSLHKGFSVNTSTIVNLANYCISSIIRQSFFSFSFQNNPKYLDLSYKTDLDLCNCLGRVKPVLKQKFMGLNKLFVVILEMGKNLGPVVQN